MLESVLPVYASNKNRTIMAETMETVSLDETSTSENVQEETADFEETEEETVPEEESTEGESTESEEESTESEGTEAEEESTEAEEESTESEEESTESKEESTESEEESTENKEGIEEDTGSQNEMTENTVSENAVSENDIMSVLESEKPDYILGREMTAEEIAQQRAMVPELTTMKPMELDTQDLYAGMQVSLFSELEESYDSRDLNLITAVGNQNPWGTCWAFSTLALMETSLVKQQLSAKNSVDLSERHLAYFTYNTGYDVLGNASQDTIEQPYDYYYLENGGNLSVAAFRLMNWQGAASEKKYPYSNSYSLPSAIAKENAQDITAVAKEIYFIPTRGANVEEETAVLKNLIKSYGAVGASYYHGDSFYNSSTGAYFCDVNYGINHAITLVGWDDNYSRKNFCSGRQPENDGAWIVKNSWGAKWGKAGYFYISYEDATLGEGNDAGVLIAGEAEEYDNNYFYSNGQSYVQWSSTKKAAQVFEVKSGAKQEILKAVSFILSSANEAYEIQIYKNPLMVDGIVVNPESGEEMYQMPIQGVTGYAGLYTIDVPNVILQQGDTFAVVVDFVDDNGATVYVDENTDEFYGDLQSINVTESGQSFLMSKYEGYWKDLHTQQQSVRMNAFTSDAGGVIPLLYYEVMETTGFSDMQTNKICWTECDDAERYEIYRSESEDGNFDKIGEAQNTEFSYQDQLKAEQWGKTYYYKIKTVFTNGNVTESQILEVPGQITLKMSQVNVVTGSNENVISWEQIEGADGYEIERKLSTEPYYSRLATIADSTVLTYTDKLSGTEGKCEYRVRAYKDGNKYSLWSDSVNGDNISVKIQNYKKSDGTWGQKFKVSWDALEEAAYYNVYAGRSTGSGHVTSQYWINGNRTEYEIDSSSFNRSDEPGVGGEYTFRVEPYNASYASITPNPYTPAKILWSPISVMDVSHKYTKGTAEFSWSGADNAEFIEVYKSTNAEYPGDTVFKNISTEENGGFTDTGLQRGDIYYYWFISGVTKSGKKVYSDAYCYKMEVPSKAERIELDVGAEIAIKDEKRQILISEIVGGEYYDYTKEVTWSANHGTQVFEVVTEGAVTIVRGSDGKEILRINDRILEITGLSKDREVVLTAQIGKLSAHTELTIIVPSTEVSVLDEKRIQISWSSIDQNESYHIYRKAETDEDYTLLAEDIKQNIYIDDTVEMGIAYHYKIQVVNERASLVLAEGLRGIILPGQAKVLDLTYDSVTIKNNISCEYAVSKEDNKESVQYISDATGADITFGSLEPEQTYYVFVRLIKDKNVYGDTMQVTLPEKGELILSADEIKLTKGEHYKITYMVSNGGENDEVLAWTAYEDENGEQYSGTDLGNGTIAFYGADGKEICRITNNIIMATGLSSTKELHFIAKNSKSLEGNCKVSISIPVSGFSPGEIKINGEAAEDITGLNVGDKVSIKSEVQPGNADDDTIHWKSSDESILRTEVSNNGKEVILEALAKGVCKITASTVNGIEKTWQIHVKDLNEILEYWVVDEEFLENEELELSDVVELTETSEGEYTYSLKEFAVKECELNIDSSDITEKEKQLNVYGLKRKSDAEISDSVTVEELYRLEEISADELVFTSTNPSVVVIDEFGKVKAVGAGEAEVFAYGKTTKENYGKYNVTVIGDSVIDDEECAIPLTAKLSPVTAKVYLEQFSHHSNSNVALEIKDKQGTIYEAGCFTFTSADNEICVVDENGIVRANPTYSGTKDKTVKVTAFAKNDPKNRKVTFNVVIYGKQQISNLEISYKNDLDTVTVPDHIAMQYEKGKTITFEVKAYGSNGNPIETPAVKWNVSNSAVATVKQNKDGTATVTMKKPGQCSIICTANDSFKNADTLLLKAVDVTPILDKKMVKLETKTEAEEGYKKSESFTLTSVYGSIYHEPVIETITLGKEELYKEQFKVIRNADNSYSLAANEAVLGTMKNNSKVALSFSAEVKELPEDVTIPKAEFSMTLQVVTKEPTVTVKEAGTINRYYNSGENIRSLLTIKTNEKVTDVHVVERQSNGFDEYFEVFEEDGQWYLELKETEEYDSNSMKGKLRITLAGYESMEKEITVRTQIKKPKLTQQITPTILVTGNSFKQQAEVVLLNNKIPMQHIEIQPVDAMTAKTDVIALENGKLLVTLKKLNFKNNETVVTSVNVWETDEDGNRIWQDGVPFTLKVKVSTQEPKLTVKQKTVTLNNQADLEAAATILSSNQNNVTFMEAAQWTVKSYNNATKKYDIDVNWLEVSYDEESQNLGLKLKSGLNSESKPAPANYKIRITDVIKGFETVPMDITVKVINNEPTVSIKTSGKLDLTNKSSCTLTGKLTFKNTVANEIIAVVVDDSKFNAEVTGKNSISLSVTEEGMPESSIDTTKQTLNLRVTLAGGTVVDTVMQIKPVCTIPKMTLPAMKTLYKSVRNQEVKYDFGEKLAEGAKINKLEVTSAPSQFNVIVEGDVLRVSMKEKEKGMKAGTYSIKVKVVFEGASNKPQTKTIKVKVVE